MHVWRAPRRTIDYFIARYEGFTIAEGPRLVEGPGKPVLCPPGIEPIRSTHPLTLMALVPMFTRDWGTGGPLIQRECIVPTQDQVRTIKDGNMLEAGMRIIVEQRYGTFIPTLEELYTPAVLGKSPFPTRPRRQ